MNIEEHRCRVEEHPESFNTNRNIKITKTMDNKIVKQADELGMSVSSLIRSMLEQYFK